MKVKIFTEGGNSIGFGHLSRCTSLYDEIKNRSINAEFIIYGNIEDVDFLQGRIVKNVDWMSKDYLNEHINNTDCCIVDSYLASVDLYQIISNKAKRALFIDDNVRIKYPRGIIVNPTLSVDNLRYPPNSENTYLLGAQYIILRSPFLNTGRNTINKDVKNVLITMGGSDLRNLVPKIINNICKNYPDIKFNIVVGNTFCDTTFVKNVKLDNLEFYYNIDAESMKRLMYKSDLAITAAGQTIYELLATQTPFIPIKVIDNQSNNISGLRKSNPDQVVLEHDDEFFIKKLDIEFRKLLSQDQREININLYKNQVDGVGSKRIVDILLRE